MVGFLGNIVSHSTSTCFLCNFQIHIWIVQMNCRNVIVHWTVLDVMYIWKKTISKWKFDREKMKYRTFEFEEIKLIDRFQFALFQLTVELKEEMNSKCFQCWIHQLMYVRCDKFYLRKRDKNHSSCFREAWTGIQYEHLSRNCKYQTVVIISL